MAVDFRRPEAIIRAIDGAEAVIKFPGDSYDDSRRTGHRDHGTLAAAAWIKGVNSFVHVTAINADPDSPSAYGRTKSLAEQAVRAGHPGATIIRPNEVFGPEDNFTNRIAALMSLPIVPVIAPTIRFQPIFVCDLARAIAAAALERKTHAGITSELAGPEAMTMRELYTRVAEIVGNGSKLINVPDFVTVAMASLRSLLGQARALGRDALPSSELPGLEAFGIRPTPLIAMAPLWLERYCRGGRLARRKLLILGDRKIRMPIEARTGQT